LSLEILQRRIHDAATSKTALRLRGGGSKDFYGNVPRGEVLDTRPYSGIVSYEPTELVVTAKCGTPLSEIESILGEQDQFLPFEPPHFGAGATIGGCVAAGLSGPRRAAVGALRDFVLGAKVIDGQGRLLSFGGQVMKNVAGYDVSRLMAGSLGTLGLIAEVSLKVLPRPREETTRIFEASEPEMLDQLARWASQPLPISATAWHDGRLAVRVGAKAAAKIGGSGDPAFDWDAVKEHRHAFFAAADPLWRIAVPATSPSLGLGQQLIEWNGALRWVKSDAPAGEIRAAAQRAGGHATLFRARDKAAGAFAALDPVLARLHRELKAAFDPAGIFNPGRLFAEL
jgi:glycolate oxidase FAD binding subunit